MARKEEEEEEWIGGECRDMGGVEESRKGTLSRREIGRVVGRCRYRDNRDNRVEAVETGCETPGLPCGTKMRSSGVLGGTLVV